MQEIVGDDEEDLTKMLVFNIGSGKRWEFQPVGLWIIRLSKINQD